LGLISNYAEKIEVLFMNAMNDILENAAINSWITAFQRTPHQINNVHESDAELVEFDKTSSNVIAISTDTIAEEIAQGLYKDPFTIGWMAVMVNMSDLAAVSADPLGLVLSVSWSPDCDGRFRSRLAQGIESACRHLHTFLLGGDMNDAASLSITGTVIGTVPRDRFLTRRGMRAGEIVYASGRLGVGNAYALTCLKNANGIQEKQYRPVARFDVRQLLRRYATACMDTSDSLMTTLDQLMRLNSIGFSIDAPAEACLHPAALNMASQTELNPWLFTAGIHGEFELLFTVPQNKCKDFERDADREAWQPVRLGHVMPTPSIVLKHKESVFKVNSGAIRNLNSQFSGDLTSYIQDILTCFVKGEVKHED
jgi:thiamine-monophosphate kinase